VLVTRRLREAPAMTRDLSALQKALAAHLPDGARLTGVSPLTTGHSNETFVLEGLGQILRMPPSEAPLLKAHDVIVQARVYQEVGAARGAPPVPKILHVCEDAGLVGAPFFIMECVAGDSVDDYQLPGWFTSASDETRVGMCADWVDAVARLAKLKPLTAFGAALPPEQEALRWRAQAHAAEGVELVALFDRLLSFPAPLSGPVSPVHGDCKIANMMFAGGRLTAVLDWELGYNGEPLCDLGYLLFFFANDVHPPARASRASGMWQREQVIAAWQAGSGRSARGVEWYEVLALGKMVSILLKGYHLFVSGRTNDERFLRFKPKVDENTLIMEQMLARLPIALSPRSEADGGDGEFT
jgi:aminoglycoside phosphotransferase (APT) family kinase protein